MIPGILPPIKFKPVLLDKPWGGDGLWRILGKGRPEDAGMGESWELSDRPEAVSRVSGGAFDGRNFAELVRQGSAILGKDSATDHFPLLYKFIYAREKLSVQVHPGTGSPLGESKTECWYVVDAEPGAELIVGVEAKGRSREEILRLLKSPRCEEVLKRWPAKRGDVFFIPAGTVHAITEGLLLYEVQQNSDTTFRLYDWGRVDASGKGRPLHLEEASQVADLEDRSGYKIPPLRIKKESHDEDYLTACPYFALVKWSGFRGSAQLETNGKFRVLSVVSGSMTIGSENGDSLALNLGDTALIPAGVAEVELKALSEGVEVIVSFVPDWEADIAKPLRQAGYSDAAISQLQGPAGISL